MYFQQITDPKLSQHAYLIGCEATGEAIIIDPQRDVERYVTAATAHGLKIIAVAETHIHADYLSGMRQFAEDPAITVYASGHEEGDWKYSWLIGSDYRHRLVRHGDSFAVGRIQFDILHTPGHTPEHISFVITDLSSGQAQPLGLISGDFVFVGDVGRPDLLETVGKESGAMLRSARTLYDSLQDFKNLSPGMMLWPGHGAGSACGKALSPVPVSSIGYELATNRSLLAATNTDAFVDFILEGQPDPPAYFGRMKLENRTGPAVLTETPSPQQIDSTAITQMLQSKSHVVVDTRSWNDYKVGHLPGALFIPLSRHFPTVIASYVEPNEAICLIIDPENLSEAVTDCIHVGLDKIDACISPEQLAEYQRTGHCVQPDEIPMSELANRLEGNDCLALDVRGTSELCQTGMIKGSANIPHTQLRPRIGELPRNKHIHVYCQAGERSRMAYGFLEHSGYTVTFVNGGIQSWIAMDKPLVPFSSTDG